ncbi:guanylate kinase [Brevibacillus sp. NPDC058079]|uniref:guanylate kinase n=1 Tax=Brevibacillus sp. NPDC058079 TaxID=3346330 RepID=UPI0036E04567
MRRKIVVLMGPSGCGKSTLEAYCKELGFPVNISHTTRKPRTGKTKEVHGVHYYFVLEQEFFQIDLAESNKYGSNYYGISKAEVERNFAISDTIIAVAELHGVKQLKEAYPNELEIVFVTLPLDEMEKRMRARGDSEEDIQFRLQRAIDEKEHEHGWIADHTIENWDLEESKAQLRKILGITDEQLV